MNYLKKSIYHGGHGLNPFLDDTAKIQNNTLVHAFRRVAVVKGIFFL